MAKQQEAELQGTFKLLQAEIQPLFIQQ